MTDIESRVAASLAARADRGVELDGLCAGAMARARVLRRRRRTLSATGATGLAAVVAAGALALPPGPPAIGPSTASWTTLPAAPEVAPAAVRPDTIGTDPSLLHFDLDLTGLDVESSEWISSITAEGGYERAILKDISGHRWATVIIARTRAALNAVVAPPDRGGEQVSVAGRPATLTELDLRAGVWDLRWQPVAGVFGAVSVDGRGRSHVLAVATAVLFDRAQRCAVPLRLPELPPGTAWVECQTELRRRPSQQLGVWVRSGLALRQADGDRVLVWAEPVKPGGPPANFQPDRTVAGHRAQWRLTSPRGLWMAAFGPVDLFVCPYEGYGTQLTETEAVWIAERVTPAADLSDPSGWPARAAG